MTKIVIQDNYLPLFLDEEIYVVDRSFKAEVKKTTESLNSIDEDKSSAALPKMLSTHLILIKYTEEESTLAKHKAFLNKLLAACNLELGKSDVVVLNKYEGLKARTVIELSPARFVIAFGLDQKNTHQSVLRTYQSKHLIIAPSLEILPQDRSLKGELWTLMKSLFKL